MPAVHCPYCHQPAELVSRAAIYSHLPDDGSRYYRCMPCQAYIGCQIGTDQPVGRLADPALRRAKRQAHAAFDPLWKDSSSPVSRSTAKAWLAAVLGIEMAHCCIGRFDLAQCLQVIEVCKALRQEFAARGAAFVIGPPAVVRSKQRSSRPGRPLAPNRATTGATP